MDEKLSLNQVDVLKEIGSIGSATAATALADMIAEKVEINVPEVSIVPLEKISTLFNGAERLFFVLDMEIKGDIGGRIFLMLPPEDAKFLSGALLGKPKEDIDINDDMFKSSLREVCNILGGAYVSALADMTGLMILTSIPSMAMDMVGAILDFIFIQIAQESEEAMFIKTDLIVKGLKLEGLFLLFPDNESLKKIFEILKV
ncbi:MAG: chemotaxis protein CheC [Candidatus Omnitrophica bacterium]|jgi:chemotaxis protein CheC|nr:chemotaxis protein CheC [Candidatus Omnitrophota bacterium]MDD5079271.1 chemotaxis protein CheC [Candidatus Omnitrophota bacterium]